MDYWQKLVLDPAHYAVLKNLDKPKQKSAVAEETGLRKARCQRILQNLMQENLIEYEIENGVRTFHTKLSDEKFTELKDKLESSTIGGTSEAVQNEEFAEARTHLTQNLPIKGKTRKTFSRLEVAEKLSRLA